jgi:adenine deaminase
LNSTTDAVGSGGSRASGRSQREPEGTIIHPDPNPWIQDALRRAIRVARGLDPADLVLRNARIINVFSGDIHEGSVAVAAGRVVGIGAYHGREEVDLAGAYLAPGFVEGHIHIESSMLTPNEFARAVVPHGTTTVVADPHELANVLGLEGINFMIAQSLGLPMTIYFMIPSCVPATPLETSGATLSAREIHYFINEENVLGLGEVMNFPAVLEGEQETLDKLLAAEGKRIDGHCPGLGGKDLNAYIVAGMKSDHESVSIEEARQKLRFGMHVMIREGSTAKNLEALAPLVQELAHVRMSLITDDKHPVELDKEGHMDYLLRRAVACGIDPVRAIQMVTINPAKYFETSHIGGIAPRYWADFVVLEDLKSFRVRQVYFRGKLVAEDGTLLVDIPPLTAHGVRASMNVNWSGWRGFAIPAHGKQVRAIVYQPGQITTGVQALTVDVKDGLAVANPQRDVAKIAVVERHKATGNVGLGFLCGFGLQRGAIASSVAHDSHNIICLGVDDGDMEVAVRTVSDLGGGVVVVIDGKILASLALPIGGLMSDRPLEDVAAGMRDLLRAARETGCTIPDPITALSFLALPVIPSLKVTDQGLVDVETFRHVPLFVD